MADPVIMFGVGAAKAGTSWLHRYLARHPQCYFRAIKELQYFNSYDKGPEGLEKQRERIGSFKAKLVAQTNAPDISASVLATKIRKLMDIEHYLEVLSGNKEDRTAYSAYLHSGAGDARVVGDVTPAYSLLSHERLQSIATLGSDVRFVYLMRDPVARLWSHVRMIARTRCKDPSEFTDRARNIFRRTLNGKEDHILERSDYRGALGRLQSAIAPEKLCVDLYENLFSGQALRRICGFLGISFEPPKPQTVVNEGLPLDMTETHKAQALELLAPQYQAVRAFFGELPASWETSTARMA